MQKLHLLGIPHTITSRQAPWNCCAFTQKVIKFTEMMSKLGWEIILYSNEKSDDLGCKLVPVTSEKDFRSTYPDEDFTKEQFKFGYGAMHDNFHANTPKALAKRVSAGDVILASWGTGHMKVVNTLLDEVNSDLGSNLYIVEPFIGYPTTFSPFRVYESYSRLNTDIGALNRSFDIKYTEGVDHGNYEARHYTDPRHEDFVIPPYFDPAEFEVKYDKEDYYLFIGRITESKGLKEAVKLAEIMGKKLIACGQATPEEFEKIIGQQIPPYVEFLGAVDIEMRKILYRDAELVCMFTYYPEPGGNVFFEAIASGTPVITSNRGIFPEVNHQGITGWRCKSFRNIVTAAENIHLIDNEVCREYAINNFSCDRVSLIYDAYFQHITRLREDGYWHFEKGVSVAELDWLIRPYTAEQTAEYTETVVKRMQEKRKIIAKIEETNITDLLAKADEATKQDILKHLKKEE